MKKLHRILAILGAVLVAVAVLSMFGSGFVPAWRDLLLNTSLLCTAGGGAILVGLMIVRRKDRADGTENRADGPEE